MDLNDFEKISLKPNSTKHSVSIPAKNFRSKENGVCSLFLIEIEPGRKAYRYDVDIINLARGRSLSKGSDDGQRSLNRNLCYELLTVIYTKTDGLGMAAGSEVIYDCKSTMYTSVPIKLKANEFEISANDVNAYVRTYCGNAGFTISIIPNQSSPVLDLCDYSQYITNKSLFNEDRSVRTFLEMAITQFAMNNNIYTPVGAKLFEVSASNSEIIDNGIYFRSGVAKGVRIVQNYGHPLPALVLDAKVCPFYQSGNLASIVLSMTKPRTPRSSDWYRIRSLLVDVRVEVKYARQRSFGIGRFSDKPMNQLMVTYEGNKISMPEYFYKRYQIKLQYPDFPAVIPNTPVPRGKPVELFPIEQLIIMEDQRVPLEKLDKRISATLLKANSVTPQERLNKILRHAHDMAIFSENNAVLSAFGIKIKKETNQMAIGVRPCPRIRFANNQVIEPNAEFTEWRKPASNAQYISSCEITNWIVLCNNENRALVTKFINVFMIAARKKGMDFVKPPTIVTFNDSSCLLETFKRCINKNVEFVVLIDPKSDDTHGELKYYEARYKVVTQHITTERVVDIVKNGKTQTLDNILSKTNCKNFGLNYIPEIEDIACAYNLQSNNVLVIGYDVAHPPPITPQERRLLKAKGTNADSLDPSVVGITANMAKNPHVFSGDYFYQVSRKESVNTIQLEERVTWILRSLETNRPKGARPEYIFVLRDGLSEGQFDMAINEELVAIKAGCKKYDSKYKPKFIFVIGTKRHYKKFFTSRNERIGNLQPGSVICEKFVREDCPEFFMQSHYPLKGVGKPVQYAIPADEIGVSQDELQAFLNALCYSHQIVNCAVSLPEPIYQADELAKRGRNNYVVMKKIENNSIPRLPSKLVDGRKLTEELSYMNSPLCSTRFTA